VKLKIRHGGGIQCDYPRCSQKFVSYSVPPVIRAQAKAAGWDYVCSWQLKAIEDHPRYKKDVCPKHAAVAQATKAERPQILAADRAKRKAERAELRVARLEVKVAERAQKKANREAARVTSKSARAAQRAVDKALRKAARVEAKVRGAKVHHAKVTA
jgi:hypothetical protein